MNPADGINQTAKLRVFVQRKSESGEISGLQELRVVTATIEFDDIVDFPRMTLVCQDPFSG